MLCICVSQAVAKVNILCQRMIEGEKLRKVRFAVCDRCRTPFISLFGVEFSVCVCVKQDGEVLGKRKNIQTTSSYAQPLRMPADLYIAISMI